MYETTPKDFAEADPVGVRKRRVVVARTRCAAAQPPAPPGRRAFRAVEIVRDALERRAVAARTAARERLATARERRATARPRDDGARSAVRATTRSG